MTPLSGQSVLITGAAHGIGAEIARRLAARGARVSLVGLGDGRARRVAADCPGASSSTPTSPTRRRSTPPWPGRSRRSAASTPCSPTPASARPASSARWTRTSFERVIEVNLIGVWRTIRACLPHVIERRGYILPVASMAAILPPVGLGAYGAAKSGVENLGHALRVETQGFGVGVGVAYFSWIDTEMVRGAERTELGASMRATLNGPLAKTYPVSAAAEAVVRGIERRSRIVACPRWLIGADGLKPLLPRLTEHALRGHRRASTRIAEREALTRGSDPVGAGGAAERAARANTNCALREGPGCGGEPVSQPRPADGRGGASGPRSSASATGPGEARLLTRRPQPPPTQPPSTSLAQRRELRPRARVRDLLRRQPRAARGGDPVRQQLEVARGVRVGVDQDRGRPPPRPRARAAR